ncbi:nitroreductase family deazaflavin-dependent oxidoreductase [Amycolatopsis sp. NBC_01480]|uniref:nitroreductase family deazaflavin-dependent oxidoreductase n=1 Tax=Amycolatopsis sp. NBC_01480 TaxID=2903562 RepID=UPI002E281671|nr:nitroreductase family deazaflavin-dependent oxidoreductase [Amycolatopsis sp. NBC_01480]
MALTDRAPTGLVRTLLRAPIWFYRAGLGGLFGHRLLYLAHRGRSSGLRREVVVEVVRFRADGPEAVVVAAWGGTPQWYRNLQAEPALEVRLGPRRWPRPRQRLLAPAETVAVLREYQLAHPRAWAQIAPRLGFPAAADDPRWPEVAAAAHAVAFAPAAAG